MKVFGLIQARMASSRLPGKVMMPLAGIPLFLHIHARLQRVRGIDGVILATTADAANDPMTELAERHGLLVVRWPQEDDIVGRLNAACRHSDADALLKVNADCPLIDPMVVQQVLDEFLAADDADFASNKIEPSFPLGYSVELVSARALRWCDANLVDDEDRELVIKWIMDRPEQFAAVSVRSAVDRSDLDLTVDTPEDFAEVAGIFDALFAKDPHFGLADVLELLDKHPRC